MQTDRLLVRMGRENNLFIFVYSLIHSLIYYTMLTQIHSLPNSATALLKPIPTPQAAVSMAIALRTRTSSWSTMGLAGCPWLTLARTPTAHSSSSRRPRPRGSTADMLCSARSSLEWYVWVYLLCCTGRVSELILSVVISMLIWFLFERVHTFSSNHLLSSIIPYGNSTMRETFFMCVVGKY